jgi:hypothetical protein
MRSRLVFLPVSYLVPDCHLRRMAHLVLWCCTKCNFKVGQRGALWYQYLTLLSASRPFFLALARASPRVLHCSHPFDFLVLGGSSAPSADAGGSSRQRMRRIICAPPLRPQPPRTAPNPAKFEKNQFVFLSFFSFSNGNFWGLDAINTHTDARGLDTRGGAHFFGWRHP